MRKLEINIFGDVVGQIQHVALSKLSYYDEIIVENIDALQNNIGISVSKLVSLLRLKGTLSIKGLDLYNAMHPIYCGIISLEEGQKFIYKNNRRQCSCLSDITNILAAMPVEILEKQFIEDYQYFIKVRKNGISNITG